MNELHTPDPLQNKRRKFLKQFCATSVLALVNRDFCFADAMQVNSDRIPMVKNSDDESFWESVKKQFAVPSNLMMVNAANLCPSPSFIVEEVNNLTKSLGANVSFQYRATLSEKRDKAISMMADFLGVSKPEIGITRNTSESNTLIINSFDFKPGDEIIIWDQNHPSAGIALEERAKRLGFTLRKVSVPSQATSEIELFSPFEQAITKNTKLIAFSHISNISGIALPMKRICHLAKDKNILTLVDGAQSFGLFDINLKESGCDFYTGSTHKWLMGPLENGIVYADKNHIEKIRPGVIGAGWKAGAPTLDEKICMLGQRNDATGASMPGIIEFHHKIGRKNIETRVLKLNTYLKEQIQSKIPGATFVTPISPTMSAGIVVLNLPGKDPKEVYQKLYDNHGIACAATGGIRLSPHIYNTLGDMDKIVEALKFLTA